MKRTNPMRPRDYLLEPARSRISEHDATQAYRLMRQAYDCLMAAQVFSASAEYLCGHEAVVRLSHEAVGLSGVVLRDAASSGLQQVIAGSHRIRALHGWSSWLQGMVHRVSVPQAYLRRTRDSRRTASSRRCRHHAIAAVASATTKIAASKTRPSSHAHAVGWRSQSPTYAAAERPIAVHVRRSTPFTCTRACLMRSASRSGGG